MSFISSFKKALGFSGEFDEDEFDNDEEFDDDDLLDDPDPADEQSAPQNGNIDLSASLQSETAIVSEKELNAMSADLFDSVLNYFNSHQPELVKQCIDLEAQRSILIQNIEQNLRSRLLAMADQACRKGENLWAEKQQRMGAELIKLKSEYNSIRLQREEFQNAQLSATRQKRALTERIRDLENQVTNLEAEREQYQLENRSMVARLRNISPDAPAFTPNQPSAANAELNKLSEENKNLNKQLEDIKAQLEATKSELEASKQISIAQSDSASNIELDKSHSEELNEIKEQFQQLKDLKENAELTAHKLKQEISESDATITQLQKQLAENAMKADAAEKEIESLKSTIESNLYSHAQAESELRTEISRLNALCATIPPIAAEAQSEFKPTKKKSQSSRRKKNNKYLDNSLPLIGDDELNKDDTAPATKPIKISAIDELMDSTDWFVAPEPQPLKKDPEVEENFGYKEPPKKQEPEDDDRQLTLW